MDWAQIKFPNMPMTAIIHPDNGPSLRLAAKLGFVESARTNLNGEIIILSRRETQPT